MTRPEERPSLQQASSPVPAAAQRPSRLREALLLIFSLGDPQSPSSSKLVALLALAYWLSPVDLIPDSLLLLGQLDDLLIVPALLSQAASLLPQDAHDRALIRSAPLARRLPWLVAGFVLASLLLALLLTVLLVRFGGMLVQVFLG